jgi:hypothetical protein
MERIESSTVAVESFPCTISPSRSRWLRKQAQPPAFHGHGGPPGSPQPLGSLAAGTEQQSSPTAPEKQIRLVHGQRYAKSLSKRPDWGELGKRPGAAADSLDSLDSLLWCVAATVTRSIAPSGPSCSGRGQGVPRSRGLPLSGFLVLSPPHLKPSTSLRPRISPSAPSLMVPAYLASSLLTLASYATRPREMGSAGTKHSLVLVWLRGECTEDLALRPAVLPIITAIQPLLNNLHLWIVSCAVVPRPTVHPNLSVRTLQGSKSRHSCHLSPLFPLSLNELILLIETAIASRDIVRCRGRILYAEHTPTSLVCYFEYLLRGSGLADVVRHSTGQPQALTRMYLHVPLPRAPFSGECF